MHIAVFGGAFDPPHQAHFHIAQSLLNDGFVDEVWFMPVKQHAFSKQVSEADYRVQMLRLLLAGQKQMKVEEFELQQAGINYTDQTMDALQKKYPEYTFSFVIGSDNLQQFHKWHNYQDLLQKYKVFVYPREGYPLEPLYPNMELLTSVKPITISSTQVRQAVAAAKPFSHLVTKEVASYIMKNHLYGHTKESHVT